MILAHPRPRPNRFSSAFAAAFASPGHVTLIPRNLKPQVLQINRDRSSGVPDFSDPKIPTKNKEIPSAEPMKDAIATWSSWRMSQVSQKVAWLIPACPKIRVSDLSFTNTQSCSERISISMVCEEDIRRPRYSTATNIGRAWCLNSSTFHPFRLQDLC